jgi:hypothetical protein
MPNAATFWGMPTWVGYVLMSIFTWGLYVVTIHAAQKEMGMAALRGFFLVGVAYLLVAVVGPGVALFGFEVEGTKPWTTKGVVLGIVAGILGAVGALGIILALKNGGTPLTVPPLVFGWAPLVGIVAGMLLHPPVNPVDWRFYVGVVMTAGGTGLAMSYKPT